MRGQEMRIRRQLKMSWNEDYRSKRMSAAQALDAVRSGDRVWIQSGCGTPSVLVDALVAHAFSLRDVEIVHMMTLGAADYTKPEFEGHFRHRGLFLGANVREAVAAGRADYTPIFLSEIEGLFESGSLPLDVVLMQVSPPDAHGFVSLGTTVDCTLNAARYAKTVIAEVNERMPRTHGDTFIHVSRISAVVETSRPLLELHAEPCTEIHLRVARNVASLIPDGATIQTGIGGISEAVLQCLGDKRDLGIHTEMCPDGIVDLIESGVLNGQRKSLLRGKAVVAFVLGTQRLFDCIHENPLFEFRPICYTNDPFVVAQNDRMVAINSALQIDLTGQVRSERGPTAALVANWISFAEQRVPRAACPSSLCLRPPCMAVCRVSCQCWNRAQASLRREQTCTTWLPSTASPTCMEKRCANGRRR